MYGRSDNRQRHLLQDFGHGSTSYGQRRASLCTDFQRIAARATARFVCLAKTKAKAKAETETETVGLPKVQGAAGCPALSQELAIRRILMNSAAWTELRLRQSRTKRPNIWRMCVRDVDCDAFCIYLFTAVVVVAVVVNKLINIFRQLCIPCI